MARSKDKVCRGDVRKHRLGEELAPGLLYIGVKAAGAFRSWLHTQGGFLGIFLVDLIQHCYSWYIGYISANVIVKM